jgi:hypothetical protein
MKPDWVPSGMSWWAAILWTLLEMVVFFGAPLGAVALADPLRNFGERLKATFTQKGKWRRVGGGWHRR